MSYKVWIDPQAAAETKATPGNVRQVLKRAMRDMAVDPRPVGSKELEWGPGSFQPRRLKVRNWRIIYAVDDAAQWVWVLAVRKRPPYDYGDLSDLLARVG